MAHDWLGLLFLIVYYLVFLLIIPTAFKAYTRLPGEFIRKLQHIVYSFSIFILLHFFSTWYIAISAAFSLVLVAYPILLVIEKTPFYKKLFVDRLSGGGELRKQLLYVQTSFAVLIFFFWGLAGTSKQYIVALAVMAWGFGDAAAALVGKTFGKRVIVHHRIDGPKTVEGTGAMIIVSFLAAALTLFFYTPLNWKPALLIALVVAPISGVVELFSTGGLDTLTVPWAVALIAFLLVSLFAFLGW